MAQQLVLPLQEFRPEYARLAALDRCIRDGQSFGGIVPNFFKEPSLPKPVVLEIYKIEPEPPIVIELACAELPPEPPPVLVCTEPQPEPCRPKPNNRRARAKAARRARIRNLRHKNR